MAHLSFLLFCRKTFKGKIGGELKKKKILKRASKIIKIPVVSSLQPYEVYLNSMILHDNLAFFVEKGDVFEVYRKIYHFLKTKTS